MRKQEFLYRLKKNLSGLPRKEIREQLNFYSEMIDDRMEEGISESDAVSEIGKVSEIAAQIKADLLFFNDISEKGASKRKYSALEIVFLVLGSPIWLSLTVAAFAVIFSLYAVFWSVVASVWAVFVSVSVVTPVGIIGGIIYTFGKLRFTGIALIGIGLFCAGLSIFIYDVCKCATKGTLALTVKIGRGIANCFSKKEEV